MIAPSGVDEKPVAQAVEEGDDGRRHWAIFREAHEPALGAAADRSCDVKPGGQLAPARQDEVPQRRELGGGGVDLHFHPADGGFLERRQRRGRAVVEQNLNAIQRYDAWRAPVLE